jgi:hypothetical protein
MFVFSTKSFVQLGDKQLKLFSKKLQCQKIETKIELSFLSLYPPPQRNGNVFRFSYHFHLE